MRRYTALIIAYLLSGFLPLTTQVGKNFEYEYALFCSWLALLLIPTAAFISRASQTNEVPKNNLTTSKIFEFYWIFFISPLFILTIAAITFWNSLCLCSPNGYIFWMAILWYPAWILAHSIHNLILKGMTNGYKKTHIMAIFLGSYLAIFLYIAIVMWFTPQKRILNLFIGFLHGPIYDTWIAVDAGILWTRGAHYFIACSLLALSWYKRTTLSKIALIVPISLWFLCSIMSSTYDSIKDGISSLNSLMPATLEGSGFTLHFRPLAPIHKKRQSSVPVEIRKIYNQTAFHYSELQKLFVIDKLPHIEVYIYPDQDKKKLWFGGGDTDVTDVHTPSIHITTDGWNHPTLRHELVHALSSAFGYHGLGFHPNMAFTEGLAVALAPIERSISLDDGAAAILQSQRIDNLENLFSPYFWKESGTRAYTLAGSLISYLIKKYGFSGVKESYAGASWKKAFGKSKQKIISEWKEHIQKHFDKDRYELYTEALYRHPGVFRSICPHSKADLRRARENRPFVRMRQPIGWHPSEDYWKWRQQLDPNDLASRLVSWKKEINEAVKNIEQNPNRLKTWQKALNQARNKPAKVLEDIEIAILESDILSKLGNRQQSIALIKSLIDFSQNHYLSDSLIREIYARLEVESLESIDTVKLRDYLSGWRKTIPSNSDITIEPWIISYLKLRRRDLEKIKYSSLTQLSKVKIKATLPETFQLEWYRYLALRFMDIKKYNEAAKMWEKAKQTAFKSKSEALDENIRKTKFFAKISK